MVVLGGGWVEDGKAQDVYGGKLWSNTERYSVVTEVHLLLQKYPH